MTNGNKLKEMIMNEEEGPRWSRKNEDDKVI